MYKKNSKKKIGEIQRATLRVTYLEPPDTILDHSYIYLRSPVITQGHLQSPSITWDYLRLPEVMSYHLKSPEL